MKKNLLTLALLSTFLVAKAQLTYVGNTALVHIQDNALVYSGGGVKLDGTAKVNTIGDFMVVSSGQSFEVASTADFRLKYVSPTVYGQLYIKDMPQANITGKVNKEYVDTKHGTTGRQQTALPFYNFGITDLQATLPHINVANSALTQTGRFNKRSVFKWNNSLAVFDQLTTAATPVVGKASDYYILSRRLYDGTEIWDTTLTTENPNGYLQGYVPANATDLYSANTFKKIFKGVPVSDLNTADTEVTLSGSFAGSFGTNGGGKNKYNELYKSYLDDPFVTTKWSADYGRNLYQHGNPFLTNVDLSLLKKGTTSTDDDNAISNLNGIYYYTSGIQNNVSGSTYTSANGVTVTFDGAGIVVAGTANDVVMKPMQEVMIKLSDANTQNLKFKKTRRFAQTARNESTPYSVTSAKSGSSSLVTKQLGVILYDSNDNELGRTFYVVNEEAVTGFSPETARMQATSTYPSIYTREELITGGADNATNYNLYINEANEENFLGKEVPLVINDSNAAKLKFFLIESGNIIPDSQNLTNGKSFYFNYNGTLTKVESGLSMPVPNSNFTYGVYYEFPSGVLGTTDLTKGQTTVFKKENDYMVRFSKTWKNADIEVYTSVGQLIHVAKKVSTYNDYKLPLNVSANSVYVVKVISEKGEIVTKKIIK